LTMNVVQEIQRINKKEAELGIAADSNASWHSTWKTSAWVFVGNLPYELTEGDVLTVFSQVGEIEKLDMCREPETGEFRGFCFVKYEDQRSTILAVDNFTGATVLGRVIRVDHKFYKPPMRKKDGGPTGDESDDEAAAKEAEYLRTIDVSWDNMEYRKRAGLDKKAVRPPRKLQKSSMKSLDELERRELKKEEKRRRKEAKAERKKRKREKREHEAKCGVDDEPPQSSVPRETGQESDGRDMMDVTRDESPVRKAEQSHSRERHVDDGSRGGRSPSPRESGRDECRRSRRRDSRSRSPRRRYSKSRSPRDSDRRKRSRSRSPYSRRRSRSRSRSPRRHRRAYGDRGNGDRRRYGRRSRSRSPEREWRHRPYRRSPGRHG